MSSVTCSNATQCLFPNAAARTLQLYAPLVTKVPSKGIYLSPSGLIIIFMSTLNKYFRAICTIQIAAKLLYLLQCVIM